MTAAHDDCPIPGKGGCPVCASTQTLPVLETSHLPIMSHRRWTTRAQALKASRAPVRLRLCRVCGHLYNAAFDPRRVRYDAAYDNALHFSPRFRRYLRGLAGRLIQRHRLYGRQVLEVGCGDGEFLRLLCEMGDNRGLGFDPGGPPEPGPENAKVRLIRGRFKPSAFPGHADLVCCRHVLEHIPRPRPFLAGLLRVCGALYVEVPSGDRLLKDVSVWDIVAEHCAYFTSTSLRRLFASLGCGGVGIRTGFQGQFLCAELSADQLPGRSRSRPVVDPQELSRRAAELAAHYRRCVAAWRNRLAVWAAGDRRAVLWGAGSKGVSFLNAVSAGSAVSAVVDLNPRKQGAFIAGSGHPVVAPGSLRSAPPDRVIVMNPAYIGEIRSMLSAMGLENRTRVISADDAGWPAAEGPDPA